MGSFIVVGAIFAGTLTLILTILIAIALVVLVKTSADRSTATWRCTLLLQYLQLAGKLYGLGVDGWPCILDLGEEVTKRFALIAKHMLRVLHLLGIILRFLLHQ